MSQSNKFKYVLQGEIVKGMYKGTYKENQQDMEAIYNPGVYDAIVIEASNLTELKQLFRKSYGLELKGRRLEDYWYVVYPNTKNCFGCFTVTRR